MTPDNSTERELAEALVELARWSEVATWNGELHARIASALALAELGAGSSAAVVDGAEHGHHETVGERQGRQPVPDKATDPRLVYQLARTLATDVQSFVARYAEEWDGGDKGYLAAELHDKADELLDAMEARA